MFHLYFYFSPCFFPQKVNSQKSRPIPLNPNKSSKSKQIPFTPETLDTKPWQVIPWPGQCCKSRSISNNIQSFETKSVCFVYSLPTTCPDIVSRPIFWQGQIYWFYWDFVQSIWLVKSETKLDKCSSDCQDLQKNKRPDIQI